jgi:hypothetical protein
MQSNEHNYPRILEPQTREDFPSSGVSDDSGSQSESERDLPHDNSFESLAEQHAKERRPSVIVHDIEMKITPRAKTPSEEIAENLFLDKASPSNKRKINLLNY